MRTGRHLHKCGELQSCDFTKASPQLSPGRQEGPCRCCWRTQVSDGVRGARVSPRGLSCEGRAQTDTSGQLLWLCWCDCPGEEFLWTEWQPRCRHSSLCCVGALLFLFLFFTFPKARRMHSHKKSGQVKCFHLHMVFLHHLQNGSWSPC